MTVQGPVKEQQPDGMSHRGQQWTPGFCCWIQSFKLEIRNREAEVSSVTAREHGRALVEDPWPPLLRIAAQRDKGGRSSRPRHRRVQDLCRCMPWERQHRNRKKPKQALSAVGALWLGGLLSMGFVRAAPDSLRVPLPPPRSWDGRPPE